MRLRLVLIVSLLAMQQICLAADPAPVISADEQAANRALSHRVAQQAQLTLNAGALNDANLHYAANLLEAAYRLDPTEPRNLRLLIEAYLQIGGDEGRDGAIKSLSKYLQLEPADMGAILRMIDLQFGQIEAADKQSKYIEQLIATTTLAPEVRAAVAVMGAKLAMDRLEVEHSREYIEQALKFFPLCPEALRLKYQQLDEKATPVQRLALMLQILRSNPGQPDVMAEVANVLSAAGLIDPAQNWYMYSLKLTSRLGVAPDSTLGTAYVAELIIADQHRAAEPWLKGLIEQDPTNSDATFLDLLVARRSATQERAEPAAQAVQKALETRLSRIADVLNDRKEQGSFDLAADVKKLQEVGRLDLTSAYAATVADLAWLKIHFLAKPTEAQEYLATLRQLLAPDSITLARLEGWSYLIDGKNDEARVKLSAVSQRDPLSALGMIRLDGGTEPPEKVQAEAKKLVMANASGLMGAMLIEALRDRVGLMPPGPDAPAMRAELEKFPIKWLDILDLSSAKDFYAIRADTTKIAHKFGEPVLAKITLTNVGTFDITLGPEGTIKPDLWVDVRLTRPEQKNIAGVAIDRMSARLVLHPKESVSQTLRIDTSGLVEVLAKNPLAEIPLYLSVLTNPMTLPTGIAPAPAGYRAQFLRLPVRSSSPIGGDTLASLSALLQTAPGDVRIRTLDLLGTYALLMRGTNDPNLQGKAQEFVDVIRKSTGDQTPAVRAQALLVTAFLSDPAIREAVIRQMVSDDDFAVRMLGVASIIALPDSSKHKDLVKAAADGDKDPLVKSLASSVIELAALPPPSTRPAADAAPPTPAGPLPALPTPAPAGPPTDSKPGEMPLPSSGRRLGL